MMPHLRALTYPPRSWRCGMMERESRTEGGMMPSSFFGRASMVIMTRWHCTIGSRAIQMSESIGIQIFWLGPGRTRERLASWALIQKLGERSRTGNGFITRRQHVGQQTRPSDAFYPVPMVAPSLHVLCQDNSCRCKIEAMMKEVYPISTTNKSESSRSV